MPVAGPRRGYSLWGPTVQPPNPADHFDIVDCAREMAAMGADVGRINITWGIPGPWGAAIQGNPPSYPWDPGAEQLTKAVDVADAAIAENPNFKLLVMFDGFPSWADGVSRNRHFTFTEAGSEQYAAAAVHVLDELGSKCGWIEIGNEVNQVTWVPKSGEVGLDDTKLVSRENPPRKNPLDAAEGPRDPDNPHAGDSPVDEYSMMVAHVVNRVENCAVHKTNGIPDQKVLAGAIAARGGDDSFIHTGATTWTPKNYPVDYARLMQDSINFWLYALCPGSGTAEQAKRLRMQSAWAMSLHLYPKLGHREFDSNGNVISEASSNTTGDMSASAGIATVRSWYDRFQSVCTNWALARDIWNTETGISSKKVGGAQQGYFHDNMFTFMDEKKSQLKGTLNYGFTDKDPLMTESTSAYRDPYRESWRQFSLGN